MGQRPPVLPKYMGAAFLAAREEFIELIEIKKEGLVLNPGAKAAHKRPKVKDEGMEGKVGEVGKLSNRRVSLEMVKCLLSLIKKRGGLGVVLFRALATFSFLNRAVIHLERVLRNKHSGGAVLRAVGRERRIFRFEE